MHTNPAYKHSYFCNQKRMAPPSVLKNMLRIEEKNTVNDSLWPLQTKGDTLIRGGSLNRQITIYWSVHPSIRYCMGILKPFHAPLELALHLRNPIYIHDIGPLCPELVSYQKRDGRTCLCPSFSWYFHRFVNLRKNLVYHSRLKSGVIVLTLALMQNLSQC